VRGTSVAGPFPSIRRIRPSQRHRLVPRKAQDGEWVDRVITLGSTFRKTIAGLSNRQPNRAQWPQKRAETFPLLTEGRLCIVPSVTEESP
jgi:hypothetical protein